MKEVKSGVYMMTIGGKRYIGSSIHIERRIDEHKAALRAGRAAAKLQAAFKECDELSYSVLEIVPDTERAWELEVRERKWIEELKPELNHCKPGEESNSAEGTLYWALRFLSDRLKYMKSVGSIRYEIQLLRSTARSLEFYAERIEKRLITIGEAKHKTRRKIK